MIYQLIDETVSSLTEQYKGMQRGMLLALAIQFDQLTARQWGRFVEEVRSYREDFTIQAAPSEGGLLQRVAVEVMESQLSNLGTADSDILLDSAVAVGVDSALSAIRSYARWDEGLVLQAAKKARLRASMLSSVQSAHSIRKAGHGVISTFEFRHPDRAGRMYLTSTVASRILRATLVDIYVESALYAMTLEGIDVAVADTGTSLIEFSITGSTPDLPTYAELKDKLWHPNSSVTVRTA